MRQMQPLRPSARELYTSQGQVVKGEKPMRRQMQDMPTLWAYVCAKASAQTLLLAYRFSGWVGVWWVTTGIS
jgi:hypothetical protein